MDYPLPDNEAIILKTTDVLPGDVLLAYASIMSEEIYSQPIGYSHASIAISEGRVLDASGSGVHIIELSSLFDEYDHLAVLRASLTWSARRLQLLEQFAIAHDGKKFNRDGLKGAPDKIRSLEKDWRGRLERFFTQSAPPDRPSHDAFFCSELVARAFVDVGIIDESAEIVLSPETIYPSKIGLDKVFGFFQGYLIRDDGYKVPEEDHFRTSL
jgi:uncharacterized protein YycO